MPQVAHSLETKMNDQPQLIDIYAMFAMLKMDWKRGNDDENARDCYEIAQAMMKARRFFVESEGERND